MAKPGRIKRLFRGILGNAIWEAICWLWEGGWKVIATTFGLVGGVTGFAAWVRKLGPLDCTALFVASLLVIVAFLAMYLDWKRMRDVRRGKKLNLECSAAIRGCKIPVEKTGKFVFRVKVSALVPSVEGCRGYLTSIICKGKERLTFEERVSLTFAPAKEPGAMNKTIQRSEPEFLDILWTKSHGVYCLGTAHDPESETERKWETWWPDMGQLFEKPGEYLLQVLIVSKDLGEFRRTLKFTLASSKQWEKSKMEMVPE